MNITAKRRHPSVIEAAIADKLGIKEITRDTFRSDAAAILESVVADLDEQSVLDAMTRQGFDAKAYRSTLRALAKIARKRRTERLASKTRQ